MSNYGRLNERVSDVFFQREGEWLTVREIANLSGMSKSPQLVKRLIEWAGEGSIQMRWVTVHGKQARVFSHGVLEQQLSLGFDGGEGL